MKKNDFISAIGYDGGSAVVDRVRRLNVSNKTVNQLLEAGLFRSAAALALYNTSADELKAVTDYYNNLASAQYMPEQISRIFGISNTQSKKIVLL